jgi:hypothetical protein
MSSNATISKETPTDSRSTDSNDLATETLTGKQRRRGILKYYCQYVKLSNAQIERNKSIRQIGTHNKTDNSLSKF